MEQILIEVDTPQDKELLLALLPKLNSRVVSIKSNEEVESKKKILKEILTKLTQSGVAEKYGDPSEWQRETRQDRPLAGREE